MTGIEERNCETNLHDSDRTNGDFTTSKGNGTANGSFLQNVVNEKRDTFTLQNDNNSASFTQVEKDSEKDNCKKEIELGYLQSVLPTNAKEFPFYMNSEIKKMDDSESSAQDEENKNVGISPIQDEMNYNTDSLSSSNLEDGSLSHEELSNQPSQIKREGENQFSCNVCYKTFAHKGSLKRHQRQHTEDEGGYSHDGPIFHQVGETSANKDNRTSTEGSGEHMFCCNVCYKTFSQKGNLKTHLKTHAEGKPYYLDEGPVFNSVGKKSKKEVENQLLPGKKKNSGENKYCCNICYKTFGQKGNLKTHLKTHADGQTSLNHDGPIFNSIDKDTKQTDGNPYVCNVCYKTFSQKGNLKTHITRHMVEANNSEDETMSSDEDEKTTEQEEDLLNSFFDEGTEEAEFPCYICEETFSEKGDLKRHLKSHTGEKSFQCSNCPKSFDQKNDLKSHVKTHLDRKPFSCKVCFKTFTRKWYLAHHSRTHTGEKPYECHLCQKNFTFKCSLNKHLKAHELQTTDQETMLDSDHQSLE